MGATATAHPTDEILQSYGFGKLGDALSESVDKHLEGCHSCKRRVAELSSDDFLGRLRAAEVKMPSLTFGWSPSTASFNEQTPWPNTEPAAGALPPELVDHPDYEIIRELGRGGMGVLYLAQNRLMGRQEVLKVVGRHLIERPGVPTDSFARSGRPRGCTMPTSSPPIRRFRPGESLVFAMEYVEGLDLAKLVKAKGPLPVAHACYFVHQAALGSSTPTSTAWSTAISSRAT